jgi:hypothetical protein
VSMWYIPRVCMLHILFHILPYDFIGALHGNDVVIVTVIIKNNVIF